MATDRDQDVVCSVVDGHKGAVLVVDMSDFTCVATQGIYLCGKAEHGKHKCSEQLYISSMQISCMCRFSCRTVSVKLCYNTLQPCSRLRKSGPRPPVWRSDPQQIMFGNPPTPLTYR